MTDMTGKTALVTGASRGIGAAAIRSFAEAGANVVLAARSEREIDALANEIGAKARAIRCDVSKHEDVAAAVGLAMDAFGGLDYLINNAGLIEPIALLAQSDPDAWGQVIDVNVKGVYYGLHEAIPAMAGKGGVIVNISSGAATGALEGWSHYNASKAAVLSLTKTAENETPNSIRIVGLSPGTVATEMQTSIKQSGINRVSELDWSVHIPPEWVGRPSSGFAQRTQPNSAVTTYPCAMMKSASVSVCRSIARGGHLKIIDVYRCSKRDLIN